MFVPVTKFMCGLVISSWVLLLMPSNFFTFCLEIQSGFKGFSNIHCCYWIDFVNRNPESTDINLFLKDWERCLEENKQKLETTKVRDRIKILWQCGCSLQCSWSGDSWRKNPLCCQRLIWVRNTHHWLYRISVISIFWNSRIMSFSPCCKSHYPRLLLHPTSVCFWSKCKVVRWSLW